MMINPINYCPFSQNLAELIEAAILVKIPQLIPDNLYLIISKDRMFMRVRYDGTDIGQLPAMSTDAPNEHLSDVYPAIADIISTLVLETMVKENLI